MRFTDRNVTQPVNSGRYRFIRLLTCWLHAKGRKEKFVLTKAMKMNCEPAYDT
jgi:hypothetical protein